MDSLSFGSVKEGTSRWSDLQAIIDYSFLEYFNSSLFSGSYIQTSKENYEEFLKALNIGFILRKAALASTPVMTISEDGGNWTMITKTSLKSIELHFK